MCALWNQEEVNERASPSGYANGFRPFEAFRVRKSVNDDSSVEHGNILLLHLPHSIV